jgi:hypothetical protein
MKMSDVPFYRTRMGVKYYESDVPKLIEAVEKLAVAVEKLAEQQKGGAE